MDAVAKTIIIDDFRDTIEPYCNDIDLYDTSHIMSYFMWYELIRHNHILLGYSDTIYSVPMMTQ